MDKSTQQKVMYIQLIDDLKDINVVYPNFTFPIGA